MPNQPKTPVRSVRVATDLWEAVRSHANAEGKTITDIIVRLLRDYVAAKSKGA